MRRSDLLWQAIACALDMWDEPLLETVVQRLAEHRFLVLDNCEHLMGGVAEVLASVRLIAFDALLQHDVIAVRDRLLNVLTVLPEPLRNEEPATSGSPRGWCRTSG